MTPKTPASLIADFILPAFEPTPPDLRGLSPELTRLLGQPHCPTDGTKPPGSIHQGNSLTIVFEDRHIYGGRHAQMTGIDRLIDLAQSATATQQLMHGVHIQYKCSAQDTREIFEIARIRTLIQNITRQWPYWLHFCEPSPQTYATLLLSLCEPVAMQAKSRLPLYAHGVSSHEASSWLFKLVRASANLQLMNQTPQSEREAHKELVLRAIEDMICDG